MIMTEIEAGEKWCPQTSRLYGSGSQEEEFHVCMGHHCALWHWYDSISDDGTKCHWRPTRLYPRLPDDTHPKPLSQRRGYCGLKGQLT